MVVPTTVFALSHIKPLGALNRTVAAAVELAAVPAAFANPEVVVPASVVTTPALVILRIQLLAVSATYKLSFLSIAILAGLLNKAAVPVASAYPTEATEVVPPPANVVTTPAGVILRIQLFPVSNTYAFPVESYTTPEGLLYLMGAVLENPIVVPLVTPAIYGPIAVLNTRALDTAVPRGFTVVNVIEYRVSGVRLLIVNGDCVILVGTVTPAEGVILHVNVNPPVTVVHVIIAELRVRLDTDRTGATGNIIVDTARIFLEYASEYITCPY